MLRSRSDAQRPQASTRRTPFLLGVERLEERAVMATFTVSNLDDAGAGSLRQAILDANDADGADTISFAVAGTIELNSALAAVTDTVAIDGTTTPGFAGKPLVEVDYNGFAGLRFAAGSNGSTLRSLGLVSANGAGLVLESKNNVIAGNYIGVDLDGATAEGNSGDGVSIRSKSDGNLIGGSAAGDANVISGNGGNGVTIAGAARNKVVANFIGTDSTGAVDVGNAGYGVLITQRASFNTIGGTTPVAVKFTVKPPDGNVISGNGLDGVRIDGKSESNDLSGNFIGTDLAGTTAVGNGGDGVAIINSDYNKLIGTFRNMEPFVFYNLVSGNQGNGLRIFNSDHTIVQANFFGLGATNTSKVPNLLSGAVIEGNSTDTTFGGVIPLGNVTSGNMQHGVVVKDTASKFLAFNSFSGIGAFSTDTSLGNGGDGFHITSTGRGNAIRTSIISSNGDDGVELSGGARGVQIVQSFMGTNTDGSSAMGNADNGVEIGGNASKNVIGGPQQFFSIAPRNVMSANGGYGVAVIGNARDNTINFSYIGADARGEAALGNTKSGVYLGAGTSGTTIGSTDPNLYTLVSGNGGHGIEIQGSKDNVVIGTTIGANAQGSLPLPNQGNGVFISASSNNRIGGARSGEGNTIAFSLGDGVRVESGDRNRILGNSIHTSAVEGIALGVDGNLNSPTLVLTSAVPQTANQIRVAGQVTGRANATVTVDVFANFDEEPLGTSEGRHYLGTVKVRLNSRGQGTFSFVGNNPPPGAQTFTATATDAKRGTSEFSAGILSFPLGTP